jgi:hypothetical protein
VPWQGPAGRVDCRSPARRQQGCRIRIQAEQRRQGDLEIVEGIGPKINELLLAAGMTTFQQLQKASVADIQAILDKAGPNFALAKPQNWPKQAGLCAHGDWVALRKLQDELIGGVAPPPSRPEAGPQFDALKPPVAER